MRNLLVALTTRFPPNSTLPHEFKQSGFYDWLRGMLHNQLKLVTANKDSSSASSGASSGSSGSSSSQQSKSKYSQQQQQQQQSASDPKIAQNAHPLLLVQLVQALCCTDADTSAAAGAIGGGGGGPRGGRGRGGGGQGSGHGKLMEQHACALLKLGQRLCRDHITAALAALRRSVAHEYARYTQQSANSSTARAGAKVGSETSKMGGTIRPNVAATPSAAILQHELCSELDTMADLSTCAIGGSGSSSAHASSSAASAAASAAASRMNTASSRSHCMLTLQVTLQQAVARSPRGRYPSGSTPTVALTPMWP